MSNANGNPKSPPEEESANQFEADDDVTCRLEEAGQTELAIAAYKRAIERKTREYGEDSTQAAMTLQELGELYLEHSRLDEAEDCLHRALRIRTASATLPPGDDEYEEDEAYYGRRNAALNRDTLGRVYEQRGDFEAAARIRRAGLDVGQVVCGSHWCPAVRLLDRRTYKTCGNCGAVFYCCRNCQREDWKQRHRQHCQTHSPGALKKSGGTASAAAAPSTELTTGSSSMQNPNLVLPSGKEGAPTGANEPAAAPSSPTKRKNRRHRKRRKAKNPDGNGHSVPGHVEGAEENEGSQPHSDTLGTTPRIVKPVQPD